MIRFAEASAHRDPVRRSWPNRRGLTRVEVAVVAFCLFLVVVLVVPGIFHQREAQRTVACQERMHNLGLALIRSAELNGDRFPPLVSEETPWTVNILGQVEGAQPILSKLTDDSKSGQPPIPAPIFLCPNGRQYEPGQNCYIVNGGWGNFEVDPETQFVRETVTHTVNLDWDADGAVSARERQWTRATGVIWRNKPVNSSWSLKELDAADGRGQTILLSETQNSRSWMSLDTFDLAFVVGRDRVGFGEEPQIFNLKSRPLGPYAINSSRGGRLGRCPAPSSLHSGGVNVFFADGAFRTLSDEVEPLLFLRLMSSGGTQFGEVRIEQRAPEPAETENRRKNAELGTVENE